MQNSQAGNFRFEFVGRAVVNCFLFLSTMKSLDEPEEKPFLTWQLTAGAGEISPVSKEGN